MSSTPQESSSDLWLEHSNFLGCALGGIAYGFFTALYFLTTYHIHKTPRGYYRAIHITYATVLFAVTTVNVAMSIRWNMLTFIDNRNYPGGPIAFSLIEVVELIVGNATYIISNFLTDGLVLYRCFIIWQDNYSVMAIPMLMYLASTAMSILMVYQTAQPGANLWSTLTINYAVPYWSLTISLNIVVTLLICGRLFMLRRRMRDALGAQYAKKYTSAIAMLVESAAIYTGIGLVFLVSYAQNSYIQNLIWPILVSAMPAAPFLILLRVASGNGFSRDTTTVLAFGELTKLSYVAGSVPQLAAVSQVLPTHHQSGYRDEAPSMEFSSSTASVSVRHD